MSHLGTLSIKSMSSDSHNKKRELMSAGSDNLSASTALDVMFQKRVMDAP